MKLLKALAGTVFLVSLCTSLVVADDYQLSRDPRLSKAKTSFEKGLEYLKRGDRAFSVRAGRAQKMYEHAEDYILKAEFLYKELGQEHGIDVTSEVATCRELYREIHVKVNKARRKTRMR